MSSSEGRVDVTSGHVSSSEGRVDIASDHMSSSTGRVDITPGHVSSSTGCALHDTGRRMDDDTNAIVTVVRRHW